MLAARRVPRRRPGGGDEHPHRDHDRHPGAQDVGELRARGERLDANGSHGGGHATVRPLSDRTASVTKKIALTASTTAPPVGTSSFVETASPPAPARNATRTLHVR